LNKTFAGEIISPAFFIVLFLGTAQSARRWLEMDLTMRTIYEDTDLIFESLGAGACGYPRWLRAARR